MHYDISFPNLGIYLDHVGKNVDIFGFTIAYYGIIIGCAILIGFLIATSEAKRTRQNPEDYLDMGIIGVIAGIAGARIYYVIFSWDMYKDNLLDIFNLREGGLAIYGGVIAAVIAVFVLARVKRLSPFQILDTIAMALLNGQMLGRWGNFFNREAFGEYTDGLFAMRLPVDAVRSGDITEKMWQHMETIGGVDYIQVSPTFIYESVWCAVLLILLVMYRVEEADDSNIDLINEIYDYSVEHGYAFYALTSSSADAIELWSDRTGGEYPFGIVDDIELKTIIRSNPGLLLLKEGTILNKWSDNDLPDEYMLTGPLDDLPLGLQKAVNDWRTMGYVLLWFIIPLLLVISLDVLVVKRRERHKWQGGLRKQATEEKETIH